MEESTKRTEISALGEFGLIDRINEGFVPKLSSTIKGIGDDAAVIDLGNGELLLLSTDMLVENVHFDLSYTPLAHLGYKAIAVNVSDMCAMNGIASQVTVSLALSNRFSVEAIDELYKGIYAACESYNVDLVGGDTTSSTAGLVINVNVVGKTTKEKVVYRSGAKEGDIICVSGDLGGAFLGLTVLQREKQVFLGQTTAQPELQGFEYAVRRQLKPEARTEIISDLEEAKVIPTSMIDVSDGLASELMHLCKQSQVGAVITEENLPVDTEVYNSLVGFNVQPVTAVLNGGEDYELLFTISPNDFDKLKSHPDIAMIGQIKEKNVGLVMITKQGNKYPLKAQGWVHF